MYLETFLFSDGVLPPEKMPWRTVPQQAVGWGVLYRGGAEWHSRLPITRGDKLSLTVWCVLWTQCTNSRRF